MHRRRRHAAAACFRRDDSRSAYCSSDTPRLLAAARQTWASSRWRRANSWRLVGGSSAPAASIAARSPDRCLRRRTRRSASSRRPDKVTSARIEAAGAGTADPPPGVRPPPARGSRSGARLPEAWGGGRGRRRGKEGGGPGRAGGEEREISACRWNDKLMREGEESAVVPGKARPTAGRRGGGGGGGGVRSRRGRWRRKGVGQAMVLSRSGCFASIVMSALGEASAGRRYRL